LPGIWPRPANSADTAEKSESPASDQQIDDEQDQQDTADTKPAAISPPAIAETAPEEEEQDENNQDHVHKLPPSRYSKKGAEKDFATNHSLPRECFWHLPYRLRFFVAYRPSVNPPARNVAQRAADQNRNHWVLADLPRNGSGRAATRITVDALSAARAVGRR
jgi:hypothetical protein